MGFWKSIKDIFTTKYKYVPPCPRCGSYQTGYFIKTTTPYVDKIYIKHANRGELVRCVDGLYFLEKNAFCDNCGAEWNAIFEYKDLTPERIQKEMDRRGISEDFSEVFNDSFVLTKKEKKIAKKEKMLFVKGQDDADQIEKEKRDEFLKKNFGIQKSELPFVEEISELTLKNKTKKEIRDQINEEFKQYGV